MIVLLKNLSWWQIVSVNLAQMIIDSAIEIKVDIWLFLKSAILWVPCWTIFKLHLKLLIPDAMTYK
jgi:hypothetical protein